MTNGQIAIELDSASHVATVRIDRPPHNFFDVALIGALADAYDDLDDRVECRAVVLAAAGKHFCAGADFAGEDHSSGSLAELYEQAARLFANRTPVVAAVQGRAVGGGLGLAMSADFRVASPETRFVCNFARIGLHHGFGLTVTLPAAVGQQHALELLYRGAQLNGTEALAIGLCDRLVDTGELYPTAMEMASEIAAMAPLAVQSMRRTMRGHLADAVRAATDHEHHEQELLRATADFGEGVPRHVRTTPAGVPFPCDTAAPTR